MGIRQLRPTNASSRFQSFPDFGEITESRPLKSLTSGKMGTGGRNNQGQLTNWFRGGGHKRTLSDDRLQARQARGSGHGRVGRVRSEPLGPHRADPLRRRREALHPRARRARGRDGGGVRREGRDQPRQLAAAAADPARHGDPQHRAQAWQGRPDGPFRRRRCAADGARGLAGSGQAAVRRGAQGARRVLRDDRPGRATSSTRTSPTARRDVGAGSAASPTTGPCR